MKREKESSPYFFNKPFQQGNADPSYNETKEDCFPMRNIINIRGDGENFLTKTKIGRYV